MGLRVCHLVPCKWMFLIEQFSVPDAGTASVFFPERHVCAPVTCSRAIQGLSPTSLFHLPQSQESSRERHRSPQSSECVDLLRYSRNQSAGIVSLVLVLAPGCSAAVGWLIAVVVLSLGGDRCAALWVLWLSQDYLLLVYEGCEQFRVGRRACILQQMSVCSNGLGPWWEWVLGCPSWSRHSLLSSEPFRLQQHHRGATNLAAG